MRFSAQSSVGLGYLLTSHKGSAPMGDPAPLEDVFLPTWVFPLIPL